MQRSLRDTYMLPNVSNQFSVYIIIVPTPRHPLAVGLSFTDDRVMMIFQSNSLILNPPLKAFPSSSCPPVISASDKKVIRARWRKSERSRPVDAIRNRLSLRHTRNDLPRNSYHCVLDDFRLFIFYLLCKIYNTNSILEICDRVLWIISSCSQVHIPLPVLQWFQFSILFFHVNSLCEKQTHRWEMHVSVFHIRYWNNLFGCQF